MQVMIAVNPSGTSMSYVPMTLIGFPLTKGIV
jgi:hypothetical protein